MDLGSPSCTSPTPDSFFRDARLFNSDIGRHSVKCNFSTRLAGRFYQNGSLERHTFRRSRLAEIQERKRRLEEELRVEERRVELMAERLRETERARDVAHVMTGKIELGLTRFQAYVRRRQAMTSFRAMRRKSHARKSIAQFFQRRYRGWTDRVRAESMREFLRRKRRDGSATTIQSNVRRVIQRRRYIDLLSEKERLSNRSAALIQAMTRGSIARRMYLADTKRRREAAGHVERVWRGHAARIMAHTLRGELIRRSTEAEKPKRVPLHLRRYSTYGSNNSIASTATAQGSKTRDARMRRRSSDAMIDMEDGRLSMLRNPTSASTGDERDENDSIASTSTSLTNQTNATTETSQKFRVHRGLARVVSSDRRRATATRLFNKIADTRKRKPIERRINAPTITPYRKLRERCKQPLLPTCVDPDLNQSTTDPGGEKNEAESGSRGGPQNDAVVDIDPEPSSPSSPPPRERVSTPVLVSEEAKIIVREVLRMGTLRHGIAHSTFDDEFSEHEDDLKNE